MQLTPQKWYILVKYEHRYIVDSFGWLALLLDYEKLRNYFKSKSNKGEISCFRVLQSFDHVSCEVWMHRFFTSHYSPVVHETLKPFTRSRISWHPESVIPALQRNQDMMVCYLLVPSVWICVETSCWICIRTLYIHVYIYLMYTYLWCIHMFGVYV